MLLSGLVLIFILVVCATSSSPLEHVVQDEEELFYSHWPVTFDKDAPGYFKIRVPAHPPVASREVQEWFGTEEVHTVPRHAFLVYSTARRVLTSLPHLRHIHVLTASEKSDGSVCTRPVKHLDVVIAVDVAKEDAGAGPIRDLVRKVSGVTPTVVPMGAKRTKLRVTFPSSKAIYDNVTCEHVVRALASLPFVRWLERRVSFRAQNIQATWTLQGDTPLQHPLWARNLSGTGAVLAIGDTGLDYDSCFFRDDNEPVAFFPNVNPRHRKILSYMECYDNDWLSEHGDRLKAHGTHVAGSAVGNAPASTGKSASYNGMAPDAKLFFTDLTCGRDDFGFISADLNLREDIWNFFEPGYEMGARVGSNSWGSDSPIMYTTTDRETDAFTYEHDDYLAVFAAGNEPYGGILSPSASKNVLSVGAHYNSGTPSLRENLASFSALGPTYDNRIKPEIIAPGQSIVSAMSDGVLTSNQCGTEPKDGTSMATPLVAGSATLVRQYFVDGWYPLGRRVEGMGLNPSGALLKALIVHGGHQMMGTQSGHKLEGVPSRFQGWGRLELKGLLYFEDSGKAPHLRIVNNATVTHGETYSICVTVNPAALSEVSALKVSLTWYDPATAPEGSISSVVNDLDLAVIDANGAIYYPNARTSFDRTNVVEQVNIAHVTRGSYRVVVFGYHVSEVGPYPGQPFSVVVTAPGIEVSPVCKFVKCPGGCSGHGMCQDGVCECDREYTHVDCSKCNDVALCNGNGACNDNTKQCVCDANFVGASCNACASGWYGPRCDGNCACGDHGHCNYEAGQCKCDMDVSGHYGGASCEYCAVDWHGPTCQTPSYWCDNRGVREVEGMVAGLLEVNGYDEYGNGTMCRWRIRAPHPTWTIRLEFRNVVIEEKYDFIRVFDGFNDSAPLLRRVTGHPAKVDPVVSTGPYMYIHFTSDLEGSDEGFLLSFTVVASCTDATTCSGHGRCMKDSFCHCDDGWDANTFCSTAITQAPATTGTHTTPAPPTLPPAPACIIRGLECSGHGSCTRDARSCNCDPLFGGTQCGVVCPVLPGRYEHVACSGHGTCRDDGTCECGASYDGYFCQVNTVDVGFLNATETRWRSTVRAMDWAAVRIDPPGTHRHFGVEIFVARPEISPALTLALWTSQSFTFDKRRAAQTFDTSSGHTGSICVDLFGLERGLPYYLGVHTSSQELDVVVEFVDHGLTSNNYLVMSSCEAHTVVAAYPFDASTAVPTSPPKPVVLTASVLLHSGAWTLSNRSGAKILLAAGCSVFGLVLVGFVLILVKSTGASKSFGRFVRNPFWRSPIEPVTEAEMEDRIP